MYILYDIIYIILFILYLPLFIWKIIKGKYRDGFWQRFGIIPADRLDNITGKPVIWIHAVSVGETVAASPIVQEIKDRYPGHAILFSTVTDTGQKMARKIIKEADAFIYFPLDFSVIIKKVLKLIKPDMVFIIETELWPNFIRIASDNGVKIILANGRVSDHSYRTYRILGPYLDDMLKKIDLLAMQSEKDVQKIIELGAPEEKVINTGNSKLDQNYAEVDNRLKSEIMKKLNINTEELVMVVGSTHPGEEELILAVFKYLKKEFSNLKLILAPRHIERTEELEKLFADAGINTTRKSMIEENSYQGQYVILLDTIGELAKVYSIGDLIFVGGSLVDCGGHNILEPAAHGKLVFFGPYMSNFRDSVELLANDEVGIKVDDVEDLKAKMLYYLKNIEIMEEKGEAARQLIKRSKGASERIVNEASKLLLP